MLQWISILPVAMPIGKSQILGPSSTSFPFTHPPALGLRSTFLTGPGARPDFFFLWVFVFALLSSVLCVAGSFIAFGLYLSILSLLRFSLICLPSPLINQSTLIHNTTIEQCLVSICVLLLSVSPTKTIGFGQGPPLTVCTLYSQLLLHIGLLKKVLNEWINKRNNENGQPQVIFFTFLPSFLIPSANTFGEYFSVRIHFCLWDSWFLTLEIKLQNWN